METVELNITAADQPHVSVGWIAAKRRGRRSACAEYGLCGKR
jgi:hypothetical protein